MAVGQELMDAIEREKALMQEDIAVLDTQAAHLNLLLGAVAVKVHCLRRAVSCLLAFKKVSEWAEEETQSARASALQLLLQRELKDYDFDAVDSVLRESEGKDIPL